MLYHLQARTFAGPALAEHCEQSTDSREIEDLQEALPSDFGHIDTKASVHGSATSRCRSTLQSPSIRIQAHDVREKESGGISSRSK